MQMSPFPYSGAMSLLALRTHSAVQLAEKKKKLRLQPHKAVRFVSPVLSHKIEAVSPDSFLP